MRVYYRVKWSFFDENKYPTVIMWIRGRKKLLDCLRITMQANKDLSDISICYVTYLPENLYEVMPDIWLERRCIE